MERDSESKVIYTDDSMNKFSTTSSNYKRIEILRSDPAASCGKYVKLPSLTGYYEHDFTRPRNPGYSIASRPPQKDEGYGPGPGAYNTSNLTCMGKASAGAAFTIAGKNRKYEWLQANTNPPKGKT